MSAMNLPEEYVTWLRERPVQMRDLMIEWPPQAVVKTKPEVILLVPAPGIEGYVIGWTEGGEVIVAAPITIPHPTHGYGSAEPGDLARAHVEPGMLEIVRYEPKLTPDVVKEVLDAKPDR